jgi:hypothetical protein
MKGDNKMNKTELTNNIINTIKSRTSEENEKRLYELRNLGIHKIIEFVRNDMVNQEIQNFDYDEYLLQLDETDIFLPLQIEMYYLNQYIIAELEDGLLKGSTVEVEAI